MKQILRFFSESDPALTLEIPVDCTPTDTQDVEDIRQEHIDRIWDENGGMFQDIFDGVEW